LKVYFNKMIESKIKDDIIRLLYNGKGTAEIAITLGVDQRLVVVAIEDIKKKFSGGFLEHKVGYGDDMIGVSLHPRYREQMLLFVEQGGFEAEERQGEMNFQKEQYKRDLEIQALEITVNTALENAERAAREAKSSRMAAWVSAVAAIVAIIISLFHK